MTTEARADIAPRLITAAELETYAGTNAQIVGTYSGSVTNPVLTGNFFALTGTAGTYHRLTGIDTVVINMISAELRLSLLTRHRRVPQPRPLLTRALWLGG